MVRAPFAGPLYRRQLQCGTVPNWDVCVSPQVLVFPPPHMISSFRNFLWEDFLLLARQFSQDCTGFSSSLPNVSSEGNFKFFSFQKTCLWPDSLANWLKLLAKQFTLACAAVVDLSVLDLSYHSWPLFNCGFPTFCADRDPFTCKMDKIWVKNRKNRRGRRGWQQICKKYPSVWRASYRLRWNFQICILPLDVLIWFNLFPFFPIS